MTKKAPPSRSRPPRRPPRPSDATGGERRPLNDGNARKAEQEAAAIAARRVKALDLRKAGATYRQIAAQLDVSVDTAYADVQAEIQALRELAVGAAEDVRELERQRLDRLLLAAMRIVENHHGNADTRVRAIAAAVKVGERRARLEGLDAPTKVQHGGRIDTNAPATALDLSAMTTDELIAYRNLMRSVEARSKETAAP